jgi:hypothetical protein
VLDDRGVRGGCCCHRGGSLALEHMFWSVLLMRLFRTLEKGYGPWVGS